MDPLERLFLKPKSRRPKKRQEKKTGKREAKTVTPMASPFTSYPLTQMSSTSASPPRRAGEPASSDSSNEDDSPRESVSMVETDTASLSGTEDSGEDMSQRGQEDGEPEEDDRSTPLIRQSVDEDRTEDDMSRVGDSVAVESDVESDSNNDTVVQMESFLNPLHHVMEGLDDYAQQEMLTTIAEVERIHWYFRTGTGFIAIFCLILTVFGWCPWLILLYLMAAHGIGANAAAAGVVFGTLTGTMVYGINGFKNHHRYTFGEWRGIWWALSFVGAVVTTGAAFAAGWWYFQFCNSTDPANNVRSIQVACEDNPGYLLGIFIIILIVLAAQVAVFITQCVIGYFAQKYERFYELQVKEKGQARVTAFNKYINLRNQALNKANEGGFGLPSFYYSNPYPKSDV